MKPPALISCFAGLALTIALSVCGCQNTVPQEPDAVVLPDGKTDSKTEEEQFNVCIAIVGYEDTRFGTTKADAVGMADVCTRVDAQVFDAAGSRVVKKSLIADDGACLDTLRLNLTDGDYQIVILAHSCAGAPTFSSPDKITFPNNKVTDTLYKYITLSVAGSSVQQQDVVLTRAVAAFRLTLVEDKPDAVSSLKFYYTGGSSTFNAVTGYGCVNSRQTEIRDISAATGQTTCMVYTFPHEETDAIDVTVTALGQSGDTIAVGKIAAVEIRRNCISAYDASGFYTPASGDEVAQPSFSITVDGEWEKDERPLVQ